MQPWQQIGAMLDDGSFFRDVMALVIVLGSVISLVHGGSINATLEQLLLLVVGVYIGKDTSIVRTVARATNGHDNGHGNVSDGGSSK